MRINLGIDRRRGERIIRIMMAAQNGFGNQLRKCGCCDKHVATKVAADGGETFIVHLDAGRYCPGSRNVAVAGRAFLASVVARETR